MKPEEAALFAEWEKKERPYPWTKDHFLETMNAGSTQTLVLEEEGQAAGFIVVQLVETEAYLLNIMVSPLKRCQGKGQEMLEKALQWIKGKGGTEVFLDVDPKNTHAVDLYRKMNFKTVAERPRAYPDKEDAMMMKKTI